MYVPGQINYINIETVAVQTKYNCLCHQESNVEQLGTVKSCLNWFVHFI